MQSEYYSAAAQVIPLLFVLIAFEHRIFAIEEWELRVNAPRIGVITSGYVLTVLGAASGEIAALRALALGHSSSYSQFLVVAALGAALAMLILIPIWNSYQQVVNAQREAGKPDPGGLSKLIGRGAELILIVFVFFLPGAQVTALILNFIRG